MGIQLHLHHKHTEDMLKHMEQSRQGTHSVFLLIKHKRSYGLTLIGARPSLSTDTDGGTTDAEMVGGSRNGTEGGRHLIKNCDERGVNRSG